jgi:hypothetical protein
LTSCRCLLLRFRFNFTHGGRAFVYARWAAKQVHIKVILENFSISRIGGKCLLVTNYWLFPLQLYLMGRLPYNFENSI